MLPAGNYYVSGSLSSNDFMQFLGAFGYPHTITENTGTLHIYIPTTPSLSSMTDGYLPRFSGSWTAIRHAGRSDGLPDARMSPPALIR